MLALLGWLEGSWLGQGLRASGVWTYAFLNLGHIAGIAVLFGSVLLLDLRLLGCWRGIALDALARPTVCLAAAGLALALGTGVCMLSFNATEYYGNPFLLIKFPAIALGLVNVLSVSRMRAWRAKGHRELSDGETRQLAVAGGFSLVCWVTALGAGRMIGYW